MEHKTSMHVTVPEVLSVGQDMGVEDSDIVMGVEQGSELGV